MRFELIVDNVNEIIVYDHKTNQEIKMSSHLKSEVVSMIEMQEEQPRLIAVNFYRLRKEGKQ